ncbi:EutN/CcmL family microcompartment protein [Candidatus Riflebacteria bacterium]
MILGRVCGNIQSTAKNEIYTGLTLLLVEPISPDGKRKGRDFLAVDRGIGAGIGELVLLTNEGGSAAEIINRGVKKPVDTVVVAIVDEIKLGGNKIE